MNEESQRIAIAEVCGYKIQKEDGEWIVKINEGLWGLVEDETPNYLHDLNAMHEAEMKLSDPEAIKYRCIITSMGINNGYDPFLAPASKRAEAYLKTIGKWEYAD